MAAMTGAPVSYSFYCVAGAMITCCGWLDVIVYSVTRRQIVLSTDPPDIHAIGLDTFGWSTLGSGECELTTHIYATTTGSRKERSGKGIETEVRLTYTYESREQEDQIAILPSAPEIYSSEDFQVGRNSVRGPGRGGRRDAD